MGYFWEIAKDLPGDIVDHPFYRVIERAYSDREMEEKEAFLAVKTAEAIDDYQQSIGLGLTPEDAREQALAAAIPDSPLFEEWEIKDGEEEQASIIMDILAKWPGQDSEAFQALALQPGVQKVINGKTYVLNRNHRWTLPHEAESDHSLAPQSPQSTQPRPKGQSQGPSAKRTQVAPQEDMPLDRWKQQAPSSQKKNRMGKKWKQYIEDAKLIDYIPRRPPTEQETYLAEQQGDSLEQRRARMVVSRHFIETDGLYYDFGSKTMRVLNEGRINGMLEGIDFSQPVVVGPPPSVPPPQALSQWQAPGGLRGGYFAPVGTTPAQLGLGELSVAWGLPGHPIKTRIAKHYRFPPTGLDSAKLRYIRSTAAPIVDNWGVEYYAQPAGGGGTQWFIPEAANPQVEINEVPTSKGPSGDSAADRVNAATPGR